MDTPTRTTIDLELLLNIKSILDKAGLDAHAHALHCKWLDMEAEAQEASSLSEELFKYSLLANSVYHSAFPIPF